jgi:hypothetical protein
MPRRKGESAAASRMELAPAADLDAAVALSFARRVSLRTFVA